MGGRAGTVGPARGHGSRGHMAWWWRWSPEALCGIILARLGVQCICNRWTWRVRGMRHVRRGTDGDIDLRLEAALRERDDLRAALERVQDAEDPEEHLADLEHLLNASDAGAKVRRVVEAARLILPLAKGYVAEHPVGSNAEYVTEAEKAVAALEGTDAD